VFKLRLLCLIRILIWRFRHHEAPDASGSGRIRPRSSEISWSLGGCRPRCVRQSWAVCSICHFGFSNVKFLGSFVLFFLSWCGSDFGRAFGYLSWQVYAATNRSYKTLTRLIHRRIFAEAIWSASFRGTAWCWQMLMMQTTGIRRWTLHQKVTFESAIGVSHAAARFTLLFAW